MKGLTRLLARRVAASGQPPDAEVSVAELRRQLVPYEVARADLALATKAEYDLAMLRLLAGEEHLESEDPDLIRAARRELDSPEPGLAFLQDYAASHLRLQLEGVAEEDAGSPAARRATAAASESGPREPGSGSSAAGPGGRESAGEEAAAASATWMRSADDSPDAGAAAAETAAGSSTSAETPAAETPARESAGGEEGPCWSCDRELPAAAAEARYCVWCGADQTVRPCPGCETELQVEWRFCPACGEEARE